MSASRKLMGFSLLSGALLCGASLFAGASQTDGEPLRLPEQEQYSAGTSGNTMRTQDENYNAGNYNQGYSNNDVSSNERSTPATDTDQSMTDLNSQHRYQDHRE